MADQYNGYGGNGGGNPQDGGYYGGYSQGGQDSGYYNNGYQQGDQGGYYGGYQQGQDGYYDGYQQQGQGGYYGGYPQGGQPGMDQGGPVQTRPQNQPTDPGNEEEGDPEVISLLGYIGYEVLFAIPIVGIVFMAIFIFRDSTSENLRNLSKAHLILALIAIVLMVVFSSQISALLGIS